VDAGKKIKNKNRKKKREKIKRKKCFKFLKRNNPRKKERAKENQTEILIRRPLPRLETIPNEFKRNFSKQKINTVKGESFEFKQQSSPKITFYSSSTLLNRSDSLLLLLFILRFGLFYYFHK